MIRKTVLIILCACSLLGACSESDTGLRQEKVTDWSEYTVTGTHELTFTVTTGDPQCYGLRTESKEEKGILKVAIVQGTLPDAPEVCTMVGLINEVTVDTQAPAQDLEVQPLAEEEISLNP